MNATGVASSFGHPEVAKLLTDAGAEESAETEGKKGRRR